MYKVAGLSTDVNVLKNVLEIKGKVGQGRVIANDINPNRLEVHIPWIELGLWLLL